MADRGAQRRYEGGKAAERDLDVLRARELQDRQRVGRRLRGDDVAGAAGRGNEVEVRCGDCVEQCDAVVDARIDVEDDLKALLGYETPPRQRVDGRWSRRC
jgi:hypothetical protein